METAEILLLDSELLWDPGSMSPARSSSEIPLNFKIDRGILSERPRQKN